ncbi:MAG TPA: esterase-like activity of phytase family protein [Cellvibrio sp.]|nr:esterase-like activity of phytase family protein [Cellvibrio sp.]
MKATRLSIALSSLMALASLNTQAAPILLGIGSLSGTADLSGLSGNLESGVAENVFGGLGSGLAYAGGSTFIVTPDRGPNAQAYAGGAAIDNTTSYISRFHTLDMQITQSASGLPFSITPTLSSTTLLYSPTALNYAAGAAPAENTAEKFYFTGRADNFAAGVSTNPDNARLDLEGIRVSNDGKSVFISDEYGPYVYQFDRATGERIKSFALPADLAISNLAGTEAAEISGNSSGRTTNKGMEGLAITPDGKTLVGIMQAPLLQDTSKTVRIVTVDIETGATKQFAYNLTTGSGVSEIVAINDHEFLIDERDGKGLGDNSEAKVKQIFKIDLTGAQEISGLSGDLSAKAVSKTLSFDFKSMLVAAGVAAENIPAKIEGMAFGDRVQYNGEWLQTLLIANDNDFLSTITDSKHPLGFDNTNNFYMFGFSDADLAGFTQQAFTTEVPEPSELLMLLSGLGLLAFVNLRRRKTQ